MDWHQYKIFTMSELPQPLVLPEQHHLLETIGIGMDVSNSLDFTVFIAPRALRRNIYVRRLRLAINPDRRNIEVFRVNMRQILENLTLPYFSDMSTRVTLGITFCCRRPDHHFVNADRSKAIKTAFRNSRETGGDVDNMVKFVMDAGTDVLYTDDRQVTCLYATKMWHENAASLGSVTVAVKLHHYM